MTYWCGVQGSGVTANGALVYVAGPGLSAYSLAELLVRAGAVRAMELDINSDWVDFFTYTAGPPGSPVGDLTVSKLLVDMTPSTDELPDRQQPRRHRPLPALRPPEGGVGLFAVRLKGIV